MEFRAKQLKVIHLAEGDSTVPWSVLSNCCKKFHKKLSILIYFFKTTMRGRYAGGLPTSNSTQYWASHVSYLGEQPYRHVICNPLSSLPLILTT